MRALARLLAELGAIALPAPGGAAGAMSLERFRMADGAGALAVPERQASHV